MAKHCNVCNQSYPDHELSCPHCEVPIELALDDSLPRATASPTGAPKRRESEVDFDMPLPELPSASGNLFPIKADSAVNLGGPASAASKSGKLPAGPASDVDLDKLLAAELALAPDEPLPLLAEEADPMVVPLAEADPSSGIFLAESMPSGSGSSSGVAVQFWDDSGPTGQPPSAPPGKPASAVPVAGKRPSGVDFVPVSLAPAVPATPAEVGSDAPNKATHIAGARPVAPTQLASSKPAPPTKIAAKPAAPTLLANARPGAPTLLAGAKPAAPTKVAAKPAAPTQVAAKPAPPTQIAAAAPAAPTQLASPEELEQLAAQGEGPGGLSEPISAVQLVSESPGENLVEEFVVTEPGSGINLMDPSADPSSGVALNVWEDESLPLSADLVSPGPVPKSADDSTGMDFLQAVEMEQAQAAGLADQPIEELAAPDVDFESMIEAEAPQSIGAVAEPELADIEAGIDLSSIEDLESTSGIDLSAPSKSKLRPSQLAPLAASEETAWTGDSSEAVALAEPPEELEEKPAKKPKKKSSALALFMGGFLGLLFAGVVVGGLWFLGIIHLGTSDPPKTGPQGLITPGMHQSPGGGSELTMALADLSQGDFDKALPVLSKDGGEPERLCGRGEAMWMKYYQQKKRQNAGQLNREDPDIKQALNFLNKAKDAKCARAFWILGEIEEEFGNFDGAITFYREGQNLGTSNDRQQFQARIDRATLKAAEKQAGAWLFKPVPMAKEDDLAFILMLVTLQVPPTNTPPPTPPGGLPALPPPGSSATPPGSVPPTPAAPGGPTRDEPGIAIWKAFLHAQRHEYDKALGELQTARANHEWWRIERPRKLLNPNSDDKQEIFLRCCDELKVYWEMKQKVPLDITKKEGPVKALQNAFKDKQEAQEARTKLEAALKKELEKANIKEVDPVKAVGELVKAKIELEANPKGSGKESQELAKLREGVKVALADARTKETSDPIKAIQELAKDRDELNKQIQSKPGGGDLLKLKQDLSAALQRAKTRETDPIKAIDELTKDRDNLKAQLDTPFKAPQGADELVKRLSTALASGGITDRDPVAGIDKLVKERNDLQAKLSTTGTVTPGGENRSKELQKKLDDISARLVAARVKSTADPVQGIDELVGKNKAVDEIAAKLINAQPPFLTAIHDHEDLKKAVQRAIDAAKIKDPGGQIIGFMTKLDDEKRLREDEAKRHAADAQRQRDELAVLRLQHGQAQSAVDQQKVLLAAAQQHHQKAIDTERERYQRELAAERDRQKQMLTNALRGRRGPQDMLPLWLVMLQNRNRKDLAAQAMRDADTINNDANNRGVIKAEAMCIRGLALRNLGQFFKAKGELEQAMRERGPNAEDWHIHANRAIQELNNPDNYYLPRVQELQAGGRYSAAMEVVNEGLEVFPRNGRLLGQRSLIWLGEARQRARGGRLLGNEVGIADAQKDAQDAITTGAAGEGNYAAGRILEELGQWPEARDAYGRAITAHPVRDATGERYRAARARVLLMIRPENPPRPVGMTPAPAKQEEAARGLLTQIQNGEKPTETLLALILLAGADGLACPPGASRDSASFEEAMKLADEILSSKSADFTTRAEAYAMKGLWTKALQTYVEGLQFQMRRDQADILMKLVQGHPAFRRPESLCIPDPLEAEKRFANGLKLMESCKHKEAECEFIEAIRNEAHDARYFYFLGLSRLSQDRCDDAYADFEEGAKLEQDNRPSRDTVNAALERVQGPPRQVLNKFRK